ncbi:hypothetical protein BU15DRAFT_57820 [Melanogaster broomeanus]|nr:hypothetical protein BU15DRAFT_57820 [Melanogaster broomeanus]
MAQEAEDFLFFLPSWRTARSDLTIGADLGEDNAVRPVIFDVEPVGIRAGKVPYKLGGVRPPAKLIDHNVVVDTLLPGPAQAWVTRACGGGQYTIERDRQIWPNSGWTLNDITPGSPVLLGLIETETPQPYPVVEVHSRSLLGIVDTIRNLLVYMCSSMQTSNIVLGGFECELEIILDELSENHQLSTFVYTSDDVSICTQQPATEDEGEIASANSRRLHLNHHCGVTAIPRVKVDESEMTDAAVVTKDRSFKKRTDEGSG